MTMLTDAQLERVTAPLNQAHTLPPAAYTSAEVFEAERSAIFHREWICVAREEQLPNPGDWLTVDVVGQPLIVVRLDDKRLHAMSSICLHRAMPVAEGTGNSRHFQCPYHLWKYRLDGELISAPLMDGVQTVTEGCRLPGVRLETWEGFVFVNLDADAPALNDRLGGLNALMREYRMGEMQLSATLEFDCPWNWKILAENFMEAYHHIGPHRESVQPNNPAADSYVSGSIDNGWSVLHMPGRSDADEDETEPAGLPPSPGLTERQRNEVLASAIMPTCLWLNTPAVAFWYQPLPSTHDKMLLRIHVLLPRALAESPEHEAIAAAVSESIRHIHLEDIPANQGPWAGVNAPLTGQGPLSLLEEAIWQLNQWWVARVRR